MSNVGGQILYRRGHIYLTFYRVCKADDGQLIETRRD